MCLYLLQTSTPHELTAGADTHTEHSQIPHVHVHSCTCRSKMLYYTVVLLYTRRNILNGNKMLRRYTSKVCSDILTKAPSPKNLFQYSRTPIPITITTTTATATTTTNTTTTTTNTATHLGIFFFFLTDWRWHPGAEICRFWYQMRIEFCNMFCCVYISVFCWLKYEM